MFSPTFSSDNPFSSSLIPNSSSSSPPTASLSYRSTQTRASAPILIAAKRRPPREDIGPGPQDEDDTPPSLPISSLASSSCSPSQSPPSSEPSTAPDIPPITVITSAQFVTSEKTSTGFTAIPNTTLSTPPATLLSSSAPNLTSSTTHTHRHPLCKKVRFDRSLTILPYTCNPHESNPIICSKNPQTLWSKLSDAVSGLRVGPSSNLGMLSSSWPASSSSSASVPSLKAPTSSEADLHGKSGRLDERRKSGDSARRRSSGESVLRRSSEGGQDVQEEGVIYQFAAWKEAKEKCGWEVKVASGGYEGACRLSSSSLDSSLDL
ncbi:hypothetical protein HK097_005115 [Rhizophlyctis rosea]|uniref:Uncharacterized protein n=1 Tax=Rhizophlyctis rosea TaxID=64517 RepID=A0AAD5SDP2_9FUNG|nr:hypothetical protein HK097_005115 [Rhizophlyctis rosea]